MQKQSKKITRLPFPWIIELLSDEPSFLRRPMFGCMACYLHRRLMLALAERESDDWNGILVPTSWEHHASLIRDFPSLFSHPVLGKWLYLSGSHEHFETTAHDIVRHVLAGDIRIGV